MLNASLRHMRLARIALLVTATGCAASTAARRGSSPTGPVPNLPEPLHLTIVYPDTADPIQAQDSSFLFGSVGRGRSDVVLSINGFPVHVAPNGSWLAWLPLPTHVPFKVEEEERSLTLRVYGVASDVNWMQYGGTDPYVTRMSYAQPAADEVTITLSLAGPMWGYRTRWGGRDLLLEIRRPPVIDPRRPVAGRTIVLDPGHPPLGAKGPAGLWEPVATLAVAQQAKTLLKQAGARVLLTRTDSTPVDLFPRTRFAEEHDADVLVSIHANALPDGVNPFVNNGTSVYYFHPRSAALVRNPWMPSALTEGLFMMIPEQEAMLLTPEGRMRYALGVVRGIEEFLREMAR